MLKKGRWSVTKHAEGSEGRSEGLWSKEVKVARRAGLKKFLS